MEVAASCFERGGEGDLLLAGSSGHQEDGEQRNCLHNRAGVGQSDTFGMLGYHEGDNLQGGRAECL